MEDDGELYYNVCEHELVRIDDCSNDTYCMKYDDCEELAEKVFCKDCDFFKYYDAGGGAGWDCKYIIRREDTAKEPGGRIIYVDSYEDQNENNDCKYFKKKVGLLEKIRRLFWN